MATESITPGKIKNVLSSFLVQGDQTPRQREILSILDRSQKPIDVTEEETNPAKCTTVALRSYKSFLKRLDTFSARTWFGKPPELNPLVCARHGWQNVDTDMLQCAGCHTFLCGKLPAMSDTEAYNHSIEKLKTNIVSSHDRLCVLGTFPCPEEYCHIQVDDIASLSASFSDRASALSKVQDLLPQLSISYLEELGYDEGQAGAYCKRHMIPDLDVSPQAVTLTFTGWGCSPKNKEVLMCTMCRRKLGLWNFKASGAQVSPELSSESGEEEETESGESKPKRKRLSSSLQKKEQLDPVDEHNHWCPWIEERQQLPTKSPSKTSSVVLIATNTPSPATPTSASPSSASDGRLQQRKSLQDPGPAGTVPAFIAALKSIAPGLMDNNTGLATEMKKSPMLEGLRCFRRALNTWSSPKSKSPSSTTAAADSTTQSKTQAPS